MSEVNAITIQEVLNVVGGVLLSLIMWLLNLARGNLKDLRDDHEKLREADKRHSEEMAKIQILVAGQYMTRVEHEKMSDAIFRKLDRIENKLDGKVDKD